MHTLNIPTLDAVHASLLALHKKLDALNPVATEYLTREQAAKRLCITVATLDKRMRSGEISFRRVGKRILVPASQL